MFIVIVEPHEALYRYLEVAHQKGYETLVLTSDRLSCDAGEREYNEVMRGSDGSHIDKLIECRTSQTEAMLEALKPYQSQVSGVLAGHDIFVPSVAALGRALALDYAPADDAICQQLKTTMKKRLAERGVRTARFVVTQDYDEALAAWNSFGCNCIIKMVDFVGSMNVYRASNRQELEKAWDSITNKQGVKTPFPRNRDVILEEFVGGKELSVEGYAQGKRVVILNSCEKITDSHFVVVGHYLPSKITADEKQSLYQIGAECASALGIRNSVFHAEIHLNDGVPYVIECASRPPGVNMVDLMHRSYGFDLMGISIDLATGKEVNEPPRDPELHYAMLALYSTKTGVLAKIEGLEELRSRGGLLRAHIGVSVGDSVNALSTFHDKCGFVILEDKSADGVREKASWMRENVRLVVSDSIPAHPSDTHKHKHHHR